MFDFNIDNHPEANKFKLTLIRDLMDPDQEELYYNYYYDYDYDYEIYDYEKYYNMKNCKYSRSTMRNYNVNVPVSKSTQNSAGYRTILTIFDNYESFYEFFNIIKKYLI
ncbi:hypothetical protein D3C85_1432670 [compost metagenome]